VDKSPKLITRNSKDMFMLNQNVFPTAKCVVFCEGCAAEKGIVSYSPNNRKRFESHGESLVIAFRRGSHDD